MTYVLAGQASELDRLRLQSRVWEPAGERLLAHLGRGDGCRALEIGCGAMGWLRLLARWVGDSGQVTGIDVDERMLAAAGRLRDEEPVPNVNVTRDDIFASALPPGSFDLVHLRFQLAPLGRAPEQLAAARRLVRPGGWLVLEEPEAGSWREHPDAPSVDRLRALLAEAITRVGGDFNAGRRLPEYVRALGLTPSIRAECLALEPGHPYLQLPVQFATSLRPHLLVLVEESELDRLVAGAREELATPGRWGTTFTLAQAWGRAPGP